MRYGIIWCAIRNQNPAQQYKPHAQKYHASQGSHPRNIWIEHKQSGNSPPPPLPPLRPPPLHRGCVCPSKSVGGTLATFTRIFRPPPLLFKQKARRTGGQLRLLGEDLVGLTGDEDDVVPRPPGVRQVEVLWGGREKDRGRPDALRSTMCSRPNVQGGPKTLTADPHSIRTTATAALVSVPNHLQSPSHTRHTTHAQPILWCLPVG